MGQTIINIATPVTNATAIVQEIFSGIQGEGIYVGCRQLFVRFHGCHLACRYCDTPASRDSAPPRDCLVETRAGGREMRAYANPLTVTALLNVLSGLQGHYPHHAVSLTGGEPLLQAAFLADCLPALHACGLRSYLETNGLLAEAMAALPTSPHFVAMDMKLPSATGLPPAWPQHGAFLDAVLRQISRRPEADLPLEARVQVKLVFTEDSLAEIAQAAELIAACNPAIPCILQPVTLHAGVPAPGAACTLEAQQLAARCLTDVRVIPQTQVMLGQR